MSLDPELLAVVAQVRLRRRERTLVREVLEGGFDFVGHGLYTNRELVYQTVCDALGWERSNERCELVTEVLDEMGVAPVRHGGYRLWKGIVPKRSTSDHRSPITVKRQAERADVQGNKCYRDGVT